MKYEVLIDGGAQKSVPVERLAEGRFRVGEKECDVSVEVIQDGVYSMIVDGHSYEVAVRDERKGYLVEVGPHFIPVRLLDPFQSKNIKGKDLHEGEAILTSPMPGRIVGLKVEEGQSVKEGEGVILVEAMKMENELHSPKDGKIKKIHVKVGEAVEGGQDLIIIE